MKMIRRLLLFQTVVLAQFNELDLYNRPRKPRPNAPRIYDASDAPLEDFSMLDDAQVIQYEDEGEEETMDAPALMSGIRPPKRKQAAKTTAAPSTTTLQINEENNEKMPKFARTAAEDEVENIQFRMEAIVQEAKKWVFNNIGRNSQRDQLKAKRLVQRLDALPDRYAKVFERCRSPEDAALIAERKKQRELEGGEKGERMDKDEKELIKEERKAANAIKKEARLKKKAERLEKQSSNGAENELTTRRTDDLEFLALEREYEDYTWVRKRREAEPPKKGGKFRPGRVSRRPEKYFHFLQNQIKDRKLQRNELKCDNELYPDCKKKGKAGADARRKFRPNAQEAMWTKIVRAMRLAPLEIAENCHIWERLEKKTSKLKEKSHKLYKKVMIKSPEKIVNSKTGNFKKKKKKSKKQILKEQQQRG
ncbi:Oidioi.mRNA.OKI2018_I69.chr2.g4087.t1.cds [Oikopleura dioica]|uniref:Oidioi.mRNA.OKI2018_I69.chr2.g4087.t1.cds n=1 Tax=Oikopleura dioica TaxID=34765 RepID=A0ABN7T026_OIKDI|nr:Oidioi.mRNA.OKI2018_I69.chr2.g4087.t1.cds [Oikopleura dioica]